MSEKKKEKRKMDAMPSFVNLLQRSKSTTSATYTVQGNLLLTIHIRQPWKNLQVTIAIGEVKTEESSLGNLKIQIFQGPSREN